VRNFPLAPQAILDKALARARRESLLASSRDAYDAYREIFARFENRGLRSWSHLPLYEQVAWMAAVRKAQEGQGNDS
jgi:hypothetical protein